MSDTESPSTITLPPTCRAGLFDLHLKAKDAKEKYDIAVNSALSALGVDLTKQHELNLDTGVLTLAQDHPQDAPPAQ